MDDVITIMYSHSEYIDILLGSLKRLVKYWPQMKYCLCIDDFSKVKDKLGDEFNFKYIHEYGKTMETYQRLKPILEKITETYVIYQIDVNILVNPVDNNLFLNILERMKNEDIDQIRLLAAGVNIEGPTNDKLYKIDNNCYYSLNMPMFKRTSFLKLATNFLSCTWRCGECGPIMEFVKENFKNYIVVTENTMLVMGGNHFFNPEFPYVHITEAGKWRLTNQFQQLHIEEFCSEYQIPFNSRA
jgi:hypothetical protein